MKNGRYFSKANKRIAYLYEQPVQMELECDCCGKVAKHPSCIVWEDDEEHIEYVYGCNCIKKLQLQKA